MVSQIFEIVKSNIDTLLAVLAILFSIVALYYAWRSTRAAERSAASAEHSVEEIRKQNRPHIYIGVETVGESGRELHVLVVRNAGNRLGQDIRLKVVQDAELWNFLTEGDQLKKEKEKVSSLEACKNGISSLPPGEVTQLGELDITADPLKLDPQKLSYEIQYSDGAGTLYNETFSLSYQISNIGPF